MHSNMKIAIVTGCGKGIGRAILQELGVKPEWHLIGIYRSQIEDEYQLHEAIGTRVKLIKGDVTSSTIWDEAIDLAIKAFGNSPTHYIANAGMRCRAKLEEVSTERLSQLWGINYFALRSMLCSMTRRKTIETANVIYISSIVGQLGFEDLDDYGATKAACDSLIRSMATRHRRARFNSIAPGFTKSSYALEFEENQKELHAWTLSRARMRRWGECQEIAKAVSFLCSESSSFMTGQVLNVDGGWTTNA